MQKSVLKVCVQDKVTVREGSKAPAPKRVPEYSSIVVERYVARISPWMPTLARAPGTVNIYCGNHNAVG